MEGRHIQASDQFIAGWKEHAFPLLERIYDAVRAETGNDEFAAQVVAWCNSGPASVIGSASDADQHRDILEFIERCATVEVCAVYQRWQEKLRNCDASAILAIAFLRHRFVLTRFPAGQGPDAGD
jgi:hypothetical protein